MSARPVPLLVPLLALVVVLGAAAPPRPAAAQAPPTSDEPEVQGAHLTGIISEDPAEGIHPDVAALPTTSPALDGAAGRLRATLELQATAVTRIERATARLVELEAERSALSTRLVAAEVLHQRQHQRVERARTSMREVALDAYVQAGGSSRDDTFDPGAIHAGLERDALASTVRQHHSSELARANEALEVVGTERSALVQLLAELDDEVAATTAERSDAEGDLTDAEARLPDERAAVDDVWRTSFVRGTDMPLVAADAYYRAAAAAALELPRCGLRWEALAAISRVEGHHGSYGASVLQPDSTSEPRIFGIPLDGTRGTRAIADTDGGALDGLSHVDRAVGPMQFIPSTWVRWASDGDGDGIADPHSLYDAARTAGRYLCQSGPGLDTDEGMLRAFFSYNRSVPYGQRVLALTHQYDRIGL